MKAMLLVLSFLLFSTCVFANYRDAQDAYNRGDYATALNELKPLAETGEARAQNSLGMMYANGKGVPQDDQNYEVAVGWYRLAVEQGHGAAQNNLGYMYANGKGVTRDYIQALMWWELAASKQANKAAQNVNDLKKMMTPADISTAEDLARECVAKDYKGCWPEIAIASAELAGGDSIPKQSELAQSAVNDRNSNLTQSSTKSAPADPASVLVGEVQAALVERQYNPGPIDGMMGGNTHQAIESFQKDNNLKITGSVSQETLDALHVKQKLSERDGDISFSGRIASINIEAPLNVSGVNLYGYFLRIILPSRCFSERVN